MGCVFDKEAAARYAAWSRSPQGRAMDQWVEQCLPAFLEPLPGERVLDIGCGEGNHLLFLHTLGLNLAGVDASPHMIHRARERLGHRCTLRTGRAEDLPFEDNAFDLCVMIHTLEFLDDPLPALQEAGRVARRAIFVGGVNGASWHGVVRKLSTPFRDATLSWDRCYTPWGLKGRMRSALGPVPIAWQCSPCLPKGFETLCRRVVGTPLRQVLPFGAFLAMSAAIVYRVRTDNMPLKVPARPPGRSVPSGATLERLPMTGGTRCNERSVPL